MKKIINIAVDIETLSLQSNAAIIAIAAVPFDKYAQSEDEVTSDLPPFFYETIDATTCALAGMHFDQKTVDFWYNQSDEAKAELLTDANVSITIALESFVKYINQVKDEDNAEIVLWAQGSDFDFPILAHAIRKVLQHNELPWKHNQVRDARTWLLEMSELIYGPSDDPYKNFPAHEGIEHSALDDAERLAKRVAQVNSAIRKASFACSNDVD